MKKILLISLLISSINAGESWLQEKNRIDRYKQEKEENQKAYDEKIQSYHDESKKVSEQREKERYNNQIERERKEKLNNLLTNENEELSTPFLFDGKVVYLNRGNYRDFLRINSNNSEFYILLKGGEASIYSYHIQNKSKISGGCHNLNANGYYNCWFTFQY